MIFLDFISGYRRFTLKPKLLFNSWSFFLRLSNAGLQLCTSTPIWNFCFAFDSLSLLLLLLLSSCSPPPPPFLLLLPSSYPLFSSSFSSFFSSSFFLAHLIKKPMPCFGSEHLKTERNATGQNSTVPSILITCKSIQGSCISLLSFCRSLSVCPSPSGENLKAMLVRPACGKPLPGSLCPETSRGS